MGQTSWQDYLKLLRGLSKTLKELTQLEQEKNAAASAGNLAGVEACMKREQVMSLSLRGYDQKRDAMLADLGMSGIPLRGLEDRCPEEFRLETKKVAEELRQQYELFQTASRAARKCRPSRPVTLPRRRNGARRIRQTSGRKLELR